MMERVKPFLFVLVTLLASVSLLLAVSCGGDSDSDDEPDDEVTGGTTGDESGGTSGGGETGGSGGTDAMDASVDGAGFAPISTGNVQAEGTCVASIGGMGDMMGAAMPEMPAIEGTCKSSGTTCPGGTAGSSDCAEGLVCCIGTDQCEAVAASLSGSMFSNFIEGLRCVPQGQCEGLTIGTFTVPSQFMEFPMGCPEGQSCCPIFPEGGISFEGGFPFEGGMPSQDSGTTTPTDAGTSPADAEATPTADASEQES